MEEVIVSFQRGGGGETVRFLYAVNVVILMIFFCGFHKDTSVVWIPKTVGIINVYYLEKLGMFLIHFDEGDLYEIFRRRSTFS